ncbi:two-component system regulatory protein YycI [Lactobacillus sp. 3B(2020)]|uniref:two-component system regulatory protein YycI n=1 Tax=Lactobacillus sp. 3B(2020) TaxID=2695882 RepID=UPI0015DF4FA3|nr:two-component system regulatory protein YycI [Lactobacillus sp. 3B(2020)]QLL69094.1 hypothetical protein GTO83_00140 [Lactobacillus sp. 3B(2020)]
MNFKRIQLIFIVAFFILDLLLLVSYLWGTQFIATGSNQDNQAAVIKEMHGNQISLPPLSDQQQSGYYMQVKVDQNLLTASQNLKGGTVRDTNDLVTMTYDQPVKTTGHHALKPSQIAPYLTRNKLLLYGNQYLYQPELSTKRTIVYTQTIQGRPVLNGAGELRIRLNHSGKVTGYTQGHLVRAKVLRSRQPTFSQEATIIWLYKNNLIPDNTRVKWVKLGYTRFASQGEQDVYVPAWVAELKNENTGTKHLVKVNAFRQAVIKE